MTTTNHTPPLHAGRPREAKDTQQAAQGQQEPLQVEPSAIAYDAADEYLAGDIYNLVRAAIGQGLATQTILVERDKLAAIIDAHLHLSQIPAPSPSVAALQAAHEINLRLNAVCSPENLPRRRNQGMLSNGEIARIIDRHMTPRPAVTITPEPEPTAAGFMFEVGQQVRIGQGGLLDIIRNRRHDAVGKKVYDFYGRYGESESRLHALEPITELDAAQG